MLEKATHHTPHTRLQRKGKVCTVACTGCSKQTQLGQLTEVRIVVAERLVKIGGARVPKAGGRIIYTRVRLIPVPVYAWKYFCPECLKGL